MSTGEHQTLLQQDEEYRPLLTSFLDSVGSPGASSGTQVFTYRRQSPERCLEPVEIAWVNDLAIGRYQNVTGALVGEAVKEKSLAQKKVRAS